MTEHLYHSNLKGFLKFLSLIAISKMLAPQIDEFNDSGVLMCFGHSGQLFSNWIMGINALIQINTLAHQNHQTHRFEAQPCHLARLGANMNN